MIMDLDYNGTPESWLNKKGFSFDTISEEDMTRIIKELK